ncbi:MAG: biopolymer transporter ExbD [Calditrichia bacterium]|nr:biopolymer transporter ExbD [Calditrichia bacterium]
MKVERKHKISIGIPTASLPDIIFMLLIFFMVATVFKQFSGLKVSLPDAEMVRKIPGSKRHIITIWIDRNNQVVCDDYKVTKTSNLRNVLYEKRVEDPQIIVAMKIDKESTMAMVNDVQQEMRKADALRLNYSAIPGVF